MQVACFQGVDVSLVKTDEYTMKNEIGSIPGEKHNYLLINARFLENKQTEYARSHFRKW